MKLENYLTLLSILIAMQIVSCSPNSDKTLVAWVQLNENGRHFGSVLTIQDGDQYDGIVFTEENEGRWIAGSDNPARSTPAEIEPVSIAEGAMEQLAVVYEGGEISMYREGQLVGKYTANNVDLLSSERNYTLIGRSGFGGDCIMNCAIEDARIYRYALSADELKKLEPDKPSAIEPYAWWDFEGDEIVERTGRYIHHNSVEPNFKLEDGRLVLGSWAAVSATRAFDPEIPAWPENPPDDWPTFHLAHPDKRGDAGDPNPAYDYKGRYHLHYIYTGVYGISYGHVSSSDLVHWKWHPTVLAPPFTDHAMFSGTGFFTKQGQPAMIYHGSGSGKNFLAYALDDNLDKWTVPEVQEVFYPDGSEFDIDEYWDPDCWQMGDTFYAISGGQNPPMMISDDLKSWTFTGDLLHEDYDGEPGIPRNEDISCANMFRIGNKWMLLNISHRLGCRYFLGEFRDGKYRPDFHAMMNWRSEEEDDVITFAPESMLTRDGRRIMWAWLEAGHLSPSGIQCLPRELELPSDGILRIKPLRELESLRYDQLTREDISLAANKEYILENVFTGAAELNITFTAPESNSFGVKILGDEKNENTMTISAGTDRDKIRIGNIEPPFRLNENEDLKLRVFIDKKIVEVFVNDRQAAVVSHKNYRTKSDMIIFTDDVPVNIKEVNVWKMKSIRE